MRKIVKASLLVLVLASVIAGCGDSGASDALTKAEFSKRADEICKDADESKNVAIITAMKQSSNQAALTKEAKEKLVLDVALPPIQVMSEELSDLGLPSDNEAKANAIIEGFASAVKDVEKNPTSVLEGLKNPFSRADELAGEFGMRFCSEI